MSLLKKINSLYKAQVFNDLIHNKKYKEFFKELKNFSKDQKLYMESFPATVARAVHEYEDDFNNKIIWLNSYNYDDLQIVNKFLNFYFQKSNINFIIDTYEEEVLKTYRNSNLTKNISFDDFVDFSYFYQWNILNFNQDAHIIMNNQIPFFSSKNNFNFTKPTLTHCYIYVVDHPYTVYQKIKNDNDQNSDLARNIFLNLDGASNIYNSYNSQAEINRQGWHTHVNSWKDANVMNSLKGKIILKKNLIQNPYETLSSIIFHFIQSGAPFDMNYEIVEEFISQNKILKQEIQIDLSNKEKKFLDNYIGSLIPEIESIELE